ncbi:MAG: PDDEXK nuclease domain-containing protein [Verrucomicrobiota bacterium]
MQQPVSLLPDSYLALLTQLKQRVRAAQIKATLSANRELILLYWDIGRTILHRQRTEGWGTKVVARLAADLRAEFPEMTGFSARNLNYMHAFVEAWCGDVIVQQPVAKLPPAILSQPMTVASAEIVQQPVGLCGSAPPEPIASLPWGHNLVLLHKLDSPEDRLWYARKALDHGWSRAVLTHQIDTQLHRREGRAITNFAATLPPAQSDLAQQTLKDPYLFDFLTLAADARERDFELGLLDHVQKFLVELGVGFAFVGRQYRLEVSGEEFSLDLLFYHLHLRCFVVVDLKMEGFKPEFAGKMNFYLSAVDAELRHRDDAPAIGLLLCKDKDRLIVEYALRDVKKPIGVAEWKTRLVDSLPKKLQSSLPTVAQIEAELAKDLQRSETKKRKARAGGRGAASVSPSAANPQP